MTETLLIEVQKTERPRTLPTDLDRIGFGKTYADHMLVADYYEGDWQRIKIVPFGNLSLSPSVSALHYGQSIYEGLKAYRTESGHISIFRPWENLKRINKSAERMCMPAIPEEIFIQGMVKLLETDSNWVPAAPNSALYIRPFMFATDEFIGVRPSASYKFIIFSSPVAMYYNEPLKVLIEQHYSRSFGGGTGFAKAAGNYGAALYPAMLGQEKGYKQLIWTDASEHRYVEESGTMNVMFVIDDTLITPPISDRILKGVTRDSVLTLAKDAGIKTEERPVSVDEIVEAHRQGRLKEAFGVGTAATIAPIKVIGYNGADYVLNDSTSESMAFRLLTGLNDIRYGRVEDKYGWNYHIS